MVNRQPEMKDQENVPNRRLKVSKYQNEGGGLDSSWWKILLEK